MNGFKQTVVDLTDEYISQRHTRELEIADFAGWLLVQQGYERGRQVGYREGISTAAQLISRMIPDVQLPDAEEPPEDNATTIIVAAPRS